MSARKTLVFSLTYLLVLLLSAGQAMAQNTITLKGRVVDGKTGEPLPFATISIRESMTGVISNEFGEFQYHIPKNYETSVVNISYLGYKTVQLKLSEIRSGDVVRIVMDAQILQLSEVEVNGLKNKTEAVYIVEKAIRAIRTNYPKRRFLLHGYYRDYIIPVDTAAYRNLLEASLVIEDDGFQTYDLPRTKVKLEQIRFNPGIGVDTSLNVAYDGKTKFIPNVKLNGANELSILRAHDPIRNHNILTFSYVDILDQNFIYNHKFSYEDIFEDDSSKVYCIRFDKMDLDHRHRSVYQVEGQMFIDARSYVILKFNYLITCNTPTYVGKFFDLKLEYRKHKDKYYLNYLSLMNYFENKQNSDPSLGSSPYLQYRELFINQIQDESFVKLKPHETINKSASLLNNKIPVIEGFWEKYNYTGVTKLLE